MGNNKLFFGGIPTEPDVNRIKEAYPAEKLTPGTLIGYDEVAGIINEVANSSRFRSVTTSWRKKMLNEHNILIGCKAGEDCFFIMSEGEKVQASRKKVVHSVKAVRTSLKYSAAIDLKQLTPEERKDHDFNIARAGAMIATAQLRSGNKDQPKLSEGE